MRILNFWAPRSQGAKVQEGEGEFGQLITKKKMQNQDALPGIVILGFFFLYCLAGILSCFHRLFIVNAADN